VSFKKIKNRVLEKRGVSRCLGLFGAVWRKNIYKQGLARARRDGDHTLLAAAIRARWSVSGVADGGYGWSSSSGG
jgi:hypothetical protein